MFALQYKTRSKILTTPQKKAFENSMDKGENKQYFSPFPTMFFFNEFKTEIIIRTSLSLTSA